MSDEHDVALDQRSELAERSAVREMDSEWDSGGFFIKSFNKVSSGMCDQAVSFISWAETPEAH